MIVLNILIPILILSFLLLVHELGHYLVAKKAGVKVEEFGFGFPPRLIARRWGETEYSLNLIPFGAFVRLLGEDDPAQPRSLAQASKRWRAAVLLAGPFMNLLVAVLLFAGAYMVGWPTVADSQVTVTTVRAGSPAESAGLKVDDVILSMAGVPVGRFTDLQSITQASVEKPTEIEVGRAGERLSLTITPRRPTAAGEGAMGISGWDEPTKYERVGANVITALGSGAQRTWDVVWLTVNAPGMIIRGELSAEMARPVGPVGIIQVASQATEASVDQGWYFPILNVAAVFAAGLGLGNLLPLPGLDGGRLIFVLIEAIRGKRVSPQREGMIHLAGMVLLLSLIAVITLYDITSPIAGIDWSP